MDRNFFLPIAIAATIHSVLFMSGRPAPSVPIQSTPKNDRPPPETYQVDLDPPEREEKVMQPAQQQPAVPQLQELLSTANAAVDSITITALPVPNLPPGPPITSVPADWRGPGDGQDGARGILSALSLDNTPAARFQPSPNYPSDLKPLGMEGQVTVAFSVDVSGKVYNESVVNSSHARFAEEALRAVRKWRFEPGIKDGKRVAFRMVQTFTFDLSS